MINNINSGIYKITNLVNGKFYIGSSKNIDLRWRQHINLLKNGRHHSIHLQNAWDKYKAKSFKFEIIEEVLDVNELLTVEQKWIDDAKCYDPEIGYNMSATTQGVSNSVKKYVPEVVCEDIQTLDYIPVEDNWCGEELIINSDDTYYFRKAGIENSRKIMKISDMVIDLYKYYKDIYDDVDYLPECKIFDSKVNFNLKDLINFDEEYVKEFLINYDIKVVCFYNGMSGDEMEIYKDTILYYKIMKHEKQDRLVYYNELITKEYNLTYK